MYYEQLQALGAHYGLQKQAAIRKNAALDPKIIQAALAKLPANWNRELPYLKSLYSANKDADLVLSGLKGITPKDILRAAGSNGKPYFDATLAPIINATGIKQYMKHLDKGAPLSGSGTKFMQSKIENGLADVGANITNPVQKTVLADLVKNTKDAIKLQSGGIARKDLPAAGYSPFSV